MPRTLRGGVRHPAGGGAHELLARRDCELPARPRITCSVRSEAKGNIVDHEYEIERDGDTIAEISKRWFRVRDTYGIAIAPDEDAALILSATVCIDQMARG